MIKNIIFDLGGVVIDYNPWKVVPRYFDEETSDFLLKNLFFTKEWNDIDRGITTPAAAFAPLKEKLGDENYEKILNIVENWGDYMPPFEETLSLVKQLKADGFKLYVLSNIPPYYHKLMKEVPALQYFEGIIASCDLKLLKPEPEIFEALLNTFSLKAEECFFIDDMQRNIDGAKRCGIDGFCFIDRDIPGLLAALRQKGAIIK